MARAGGSGGRRGVGGGGQRRGERVAVANLYMIMLSWNKFYDFLKHESLFSKF
jgi:hypothetical protein